MKRFVAFCCNICYPIGGAEDIIGSFDSLEAAKSAVDGAISAEDDRFGSVLDTRTGETWTRHPENSESYRDWLLED